jgi:hypothetical protein
VEKKSLDCIKCGGPLSNMGGENKYICDYCKTPYLVEEEDDKYVLSIIDSRLSSLEDKIKGIVTCPPKTDPEVVLGLVHIGGRKDGKAHTIYTGADHHQIA